MLDRSNRRINYLRLSITDNCNLRCQYCLPENPNSFSKSSTLLSSDDIQKIVEAFSLIGIKKIRITGGEPLVRKDFPEILKKINKIQGIEKIAITTNGFNLLENLNEFEENGLNRINISLDSLNKKKYSEITRGGDFDKVFETIKKISEMNFERVRLNVVIMKGINDDEILDFVNLTRNLNIGVRFIELMPIGEGKKFTSMKNSEIISFIKQTYELLVNSNESTDGPATYYKIPNFLGEIGFISPLSNRFCDKCNRIRVTSSGFLKLCLHYNEGIDLLQYLRKNISIKELAEIIEAAIYSKKPKEHKMNSLETVENIETKGMNEIGG
ncbi:MULTISPECIES: GTP 3',8-cyclase MoaA [unclassified Cetobacterium]|uniref:GTP 3',8-cyclase MoaA n=1 Tax=unclassified Cetobacterium TaxID=2630983 RepID=UPI00064795DF|nr:MULTISPECIES: GTP 3',8-cyclase MoaA [unclassified Cetobacterium]